MEPVAGEIRLLNVKKALGVEDIPVGLIKSEVPWTSKALYDLVGDKLTCDNYKGISLSVRSIKSSRKL